MVKMQSRHFLAEPILIGLIAILCTSCASVGVRQQAAHERNIERTVQMLIATGDSDSLAAAALLNVGPIVNPREGLALIARAVEKAPDRPDLIWLNIRLCAQVEGCNPEPLEAQLRALDTDNGVAWLDSIGRSAKLNDVVGVRNNLMGIARSKRFDVYWNSTIVHIANAMLKTQTINLTSAFLFTTGIAAGIVIPAYEPILHACKGKALQDPEVLNACHQVSSVMRAGDIYMTEIIGLSIAKRTWPEGSAEYLDAIKATGVAHYQMNTDGKISLHRLWSSRYFRKRLQLMTDNKTQQEVTSAEIMNAKLSPNPPSSWTDKLGGS